MVCTHNEVVASISKPINTFKNTWLLRQNIKALLKLGH